MARITTAEIEHKIGRISAATGKAYRLSKIKQGYQLQHELGYRAIVDGRYTKRELSLILDGMLAGLNESKPDNSCRMVGE
jgi:hypothetical protein